MPAQISSFSFRAVLPTNPAPESSFSLPLKERKQRAPPRRLVLVQLTVYIPCASKVPTARDWATKMSRAVADAGINLRGVSAAALGRRAVTYFAFDSAADADTAIRILKKALK